MATPPERFRTHDCSWRDLGLLEKIAERFSKGSGLHVVGVSAKGRMTQRYVGTLRSGLAKSAEFAAPLVTCSGKIRNPLGHALGPNVRVRAAFRNAAYVDDGLHAGAAYERGELDFAGRSMTEGVDLHVRDGGYRMPSEAALDAGDAGTEDRREGSSF